MISTKTPKIVQCICPKIAHCHIFLDCTSFHEFSSIPGPNIVNLRYFALKTLGRNWGELRKMTFWDGQSWHLRLSKIQGSTAKWNKKWLDEIVKHEYAIQYSTGQCGNLLKHTVVLRTPFICFPMNVLKNYLFVEYWKSILMRQLGRRKHTLVCY